MKRIFKLLLPASALCLKAFTSCAVADDQTISSIEIVSSLNDLTLIQDESYTTDLIEVKCYNSSHQEIKQEVKLVLTLDGNKPLPSWITVNNNKIEIHDDKEPGMYNFKLYAYSKDKQIRSESKEFSLNVIPVRHILPDKIELNIEDDIWVMYGEQTPISATIIPSKEGIDEKYLIKDCKFDVQVLEGKELDLDNNKLFYFNQNKNEGNLFVSERTNESFIGKYVIKVTASLLGKPDIQDNKIITIHMDNIYMQKDKNNVIYTRESRNDTWTITKLNPNYQYVSISTETIQNKKVTKVAPKLCQKSGIVNLIEIRLPESIDTIGDGAFAYQTVLSNVAAPGLKYVGENAFSNCYVMSFMEAPKLPQLKVVKNNGFYFCKNLNLTQQNEIEQIGKNAFVNAEFSTFEIGENCQEIGEFAFLDCTNLKSFKIWSRTPPLISGGALTNTDKLTSVQVPTESLELYKSDPNWNSIGKTIEGI